ncbi:MAG: class I SAM-dependent methyltransferase [Chloroflexi bacterium]|nr:MAG: class I SAM-dependent methyltransferase [Chloroflexota bacterium]
MDKDKRTQETYTQIAESYLKNNQDRSIVVPEIERFVSLVRPGGLVFDVGCGPGYDTAVFHTHNLHAIGMDYNWQMMHTGRSQQQLTYDFVQVDMRHLPLRTCADGLWVSASLLHIPHNEVPATLREFHRVLRPDGILYLAVKLGEGELWTEKSHGHDLPRYFSLWQPEELDRMLETAVFTIIDGWLNEQTRSPWIIRFAQK